jgi:hypothetical protein
VICVDVLEQDPPRDRLDPVAERVARNDAAFRDSNERVVGLAQSFRDDLEAPLPVLCECADVSCTEVVQLTLREYESVRQVPTWFINAPGHHRNGRGWVSVVATCEGYEVVEKVGDAAEIAIELDPRGDDDE